MGGWPELGETSRSLTLPGNPNADDDGDGYTNLEERLHQMASGSTPTPKPYDLNGDGKAGGGELIILLQNWGLTALTEGDFNNSGKIDAGDLIIVLRNWGNP